MLDKRTTQMLDVANQMTEEDLDYLRSNVQRIVAERERLYAELGKFDFLCPYPSQSNFILCRVLSSSKGCVLSSSKGRVPGRGAHELKLS